MNLSQDRLNTEGDRSPGLVGAGQEVGEAREHHDGGVLPHRPQGLGEHRQTTTRKELAAGHLRAVAAVGRVQVTLDIRIAENGKSSNSRHREGNQWTEHEADQARGDK